MPLNADISAALQLLEHIQHTIDISDDAKLQAQTSDDLSMLIAVLENPVFRSIVTVQDSLSELGQQMQQHPSLLPVDFDITTCGDLVVTAPSGDLFDVDYPAREVDDQRVPVAKLSNSSSGDSPSPKMLSEAAPQTPITTPTYALEFQRAIEESARGREVLTVQLYKPDGNSLGFSVVGLRSDDKGELGIFVQEIQNTGIAGIDGRLHESDQILAIDGQPLDSNISHQQAISILQKARGLVELVVARNEEEGEEEEEGQVALVERSSSAVSDISKEGSDMVLNTEWAQVEVIDLINDGSGLGFGIIGGRSTGVVVKTILPGGVADRDNRLQSGDHILQIGDVNLRGMGSEQVAAVLRQSGSHVRLVVARPVEPTSPDYQALGSHAPIVPTKILGDPEELDRHLLQNGYPETFSSHPTMESYDTPFIFAAQDSDIELHPELGLVVDVVRNPLPIRAAPLSMVALDTDALPEVEEFTVNLKKDYHGLGITIAGYVCEKEELSGIFVKSISEGSAADACKRIAVNDRIVEVDNRSLQGYTNHQAVEVLRATGQVVRLRLERYLRGPKYEQLQQAIAASELRPDSPASPSAASLPRFPVTMDGEDIEIEIEGESHTTMDSLVLEPLEAVNPELVSITSSDYEGPLTPSTEAALVNKWSSLVDGADIVVAQLRKLSEGGGLGISLEGTVDVEDGREVRPHHYIRSILPDGPVGSNGKLSSGDELLEVNGHRLLGMNHIEVVTILKELPMSVRMVCARRPGDTATYRVIDTSQDRAAFAARSILGGSLQNLLPASDRLVKAKSDGSLASTATATDASSFSKMKSRSLEPLTGLAMWSSEPHMIELVKGERGLGFSILDYQDPLNASETVIVIRSLVPGGVAQMDGRLIPGDRLLSVNEADLENASLDQAVQALKGAPKGVVRIGVAKPLPIPDSVSHSQEFLEGLSQATPTLDDHSMLSSSDSLSPAGSDLEGMSTDKEPPPLPASSPPPPPPLDDEEEEETNEEVAACWATDVVQLPTALEKDVRIHKGSESLGLSVDCVDKGVNGMLVVAVASGGAVARDGRVRPGDFLLAVNNESLRKVTNSQARAILRRAQLLSADISVTYIPGEAASLYRRSLSLADSSLAPALQPIKISPRSPFISETKLVAVTQLPISGDEATTPLAEQVEQIGLAEEKTAVHEVRTEIEEDRDTLCTEKPVLGFESDVTDGIKTVSVGTVSVVEQVHLSERTIQVNDAMTVATTEDAVLLARHWGPERAVEVLREPNCSLGISIVGGKVDLCSAGPPEGAAISGIFIKNVLPESPAGRTGQLKTGDRILAVDGIDLRLASHERAVDVIRAAGNPVHFLVQSLIQWESQVAASSAGTAGRRDAPAAPLMAAPPVLVSAHARTPSPEIIQAGISTESGEAVAPNPPAQPAAQPAQPAAQPEQPATQPQRGKPDTAASYSSSEEEEEEDVRDLEGRIYTRQGQEINRSSAGNVKRSRAEAEADPEQEDAFGYTTNKVKKKYGDGVLMVQLERGHAGLGLSIAGHKDRNRMAVFVVGLNPSGMASRAGSIRVGDEIVEVNGVVVQGRCHLNASAIIKGLPGPVFKVILLRREAAIEDLAVKPITQFPVTLDDETPEERYSSFKGLRTVTIKKPSIVDLAASPIQQGTQGLGIMIIEGKHAEVGQGIFISDIQEGSAAEQAGLIVGDMILAVNKDTMLGSNYDAAANLLRKTEGVVTLVVCNPNKAAPAEPAAAPAGLSVADKPAPARSPTPTQRAVSPAPPDKSRDPSPTPGDEAVSDPMTCPIVPGKETTIEIFRDKIGLGICIVGGTDTLLGMVIVQEVYPEGAAGKDNRLRPGDQILEVNAHDFRTITHAKAVAAIRQTPSKVKLVVLRDESLAEASMDTVDVEVTKKPGKGLGLSVIGRKTGAGVFISDVVHGGAAEADGRLMKGDQILSVNGEDLKTATPEEAAAVLKTATGRVAIKLGRLKTGSRRPAAARELCLPAAAAPPPVLTTSQSFPRYVRKRGALMRHFASWSFRRRPTPSPPNPPSWSSQRPPASAATATTA